MSSIRLASMLASSVFLVILTTAAPSAEPKPSATAGSAAASASAEAFTYKTPQGATFKVTAEGLASITVGDKEVVKGSWHAGNMTQLREPNAGPAPLVFTDKTLEVIEPRSCVRVRHVGPAATATFEYAFEGEDVRIKARVENFTDKAIKATSFEGLSFLFDSTPKGWMVSQDPGWIKAHVEGFRGFHPSFENRIGGSYATDETFGVGLTPLNTGLAYTGFFWWGDTAGPNARRLVYIRPQEIPSGGALTFEMLMRISPNKDWKHLLDPYKQHFAKTFGHPTLGSVHYKADFRPMASMSIADTPSITKDNPFGFHGESRRVDLPEGMKRFCDMVVPGLVAGNGQGMIIWALGGWDPRGAMYRPDFDVLPPAVEQNIPQMRQAFQDGNVRMGVCTRPGEIAFRGTWTQDWTVRINPDDPQHLQIMWGRFKKMIDQGFTLFYLDTFGESLNDIKAMQYYRQKMGPEIQTFVEHPCDVMLAYSGAYMELNYNEKAGAYSIFWGLDRFWEISQYLLPGAQAAAVSRVDEKKLPAGFERPAHFLMRQHVAPFIPDYLIKGQAKELKEITDEFLDANGQWKK
jgi:hypothetical protein